LKKTLVVLAILILGGWLAGRMLVRSWTAKPPPLPADQTILRATPEVRDGRTWLGQSWVGIREGLPVIRLKGAPFDMGYASGKLLEKPLHTLEEEFLVMIKGYVPQNWKLNLLKTYVVYRNRRLSDYLSLADRQQLHGVVLGCRDAHPELGDFYNRMLNYHAAHDISYMMIDNPLASKAGCTAFGAWGRATVGGHLVTGRNFDWEAAPVFGRERYVILCEPDDAIPFVSLAWAGLAGAVSGLNRAGVSVTINGAPSSLPAETATPVALVARQVLQQAHNLPEALEIIKKSRVFVSTLWLVGSRADGKFVVVERTPKAMAVREPEGDRIVSANHFETEPLKDDARNVRYLAEATSLSRYQRLSELIETNRGRLDAVTAAAMLRDQRLPGGGFPGHGHRATLNPLIATHATIMDLTDGIFWAAAPPHQLGRFVAFDVHDFDRELPALTIPADALVTTGDFEKIQLARQALRAGRQAMSQADPRTALAAAGRAEANNPGFYQNAWLRGLALLGLERPAEAATALRAALAAQPAFRSEKQEIEVLLYQAEKNH
jgi:hypothetical protein